MFAFHSDVAISNQKPSKKMGLISGDMAPSRYSTGIEYVNNSIIHSLLFSDDRRSKQKLLRTQKDPAKSRFISQSFDSGLGKTQTDNSITSEVEDDSEDVFAKYSTASAPSLRAFLIRPLTGKKHQLRVMLKSLRAPALGDPLYATKDNFEKSASDRCYLHACALSIAMPEGGGVHDGHDDDVAAAASSSSSSNVVQVLLVLGDCVYDVGLATFLHSLFG
jgi:hypothetical protein